MNIYFRLVVFIFGISLVGCAGSVSTALLDQQAPLSRLYLVDSNLASKEVKTLDDYRGKNVVLMFWATHCTFSHRVLDDLNEYAEKYGKRKNFEVVAVSVDEPKDEQKLKERIVYGKLSNISHVYSGTDIHDEAYRAFDVGSLPTIFVIDPSGKVRAVGSSASVVTDTFGDS